MLFDKLLPVMNLIEQVQPIATIAVGFVEKFSGEKTAEEKKKEAVQVIKKGLDSAGLNVPDSFDTLEEFLIGTAIDYIVKYFNSSGIFSHKEEKKAEV